jgi:outer membrane immunogenic protein
MAHALRAHLAWTLAGALTVGIAASAGAADLGEDQVFADHSIAGSDWTGIYMGVAAGWGTGTSEAEISPGNRVGVDSEGSLASIYGGYNFQMGRIVVGIEGDYSWTDSEGSSACTLAVGVTGTCSASLENAATLRARLGFAMDRLHIYGTLGVGWADVTGRVEAVTPLGTIDVSASETVPALVYGAGAEWKVHDRLSLRGDVMRLSFDSQDFSFTGLGDTEADIDATVVRAGLTWHVN